MSTTRESTINSYVTDMLALEEHIEKALKGQVTEFQADYPEVGRSLLEMHAAILGHIGTLKGLAAAQDTNKVGDVMKRAASVVAGIGAAAIDMVRTEKLPKDLRDDFTACSLAGVGYMMLYTTASALGDDTVAQVASSHLSDYSAMTMELTRLIPGAVVQLLHSDGLTPDSSVLSDVQRTIAAAYSGAASTSGR